MNTANNGKYSITSPPLCTKQREREREEEREGESGRERKKGRGRKGERYLKRTLVHLSYLKILLLENTHIIITLTNITLRRYSQILLFLKIV